MGRTCLVCRHPEREQIELKLLQGVTYEELANEYGMSISSVSRHKDHINRSLAKAQDAKEAVAGGNLLERLEILEADAKRIGQIAESHERLSVALQANREQQRIIELLLKVAGELKDSQEINITVNQDWVKLREIILTCLSPYPEARHALLTGLKIYQETGRVPEENEIGEIVNGKVRVLSRNLLEEKRAERDG